MDSECKEILEIAMSGTKTSSGSIFVENSVVSTASKMKYKDEYVVAYNKREHKYKVKELYNGILCKANLNKVSLLIYGGSDWANDSSTFISEEVWLLASESGKYTPGVTYTCELGDGGEKTFFVLEDGDKTTLTEEKGRVAQEGEVSLIMSNLIDEQGKGTNEFVASEWSSDVSNHRYEDKKEQEVTLKEELQNGMG